MQQKEFVILTKSFITLFLVVGAASTQVLAPEEIRDPQLRALQQKYRGELKLIPQALSSNLPYRFYFSRRMDLEESVQKRSDQRSIRFDRYQGRLVLKITGNYFVSYSDELIKPEERARLTYETIMLPLLGAAVHALEKADVPEAFAFEISHHVLKKVLGVPSEGAENVVLVLPKSSAQRLVSAVNQQARDAALFEGEAFLNAVPVSLWKEEETPQEATKAPVTARAAAAPPTIPPEPTVSARIINGSGLPLLGSKFVADPPAKLPDPSEPERKPADEPSGPAKAPDPANNSASSLNDLQQAEQPTLDRMVKELDSQAHFVSYAPPAVISFRSQPYLQLSLTTTLPPGAAGSQYRLAALAFDQHIAHLIRPVVAYFKDHPDFDGIDFSTSVRLATAKADISSLAVEFIFPIKLMRSYADFDSTGQQLIDRAYVLINGERVSLNLQAAEGGAAAQ